MFANGTVASVKDIIARTESVALEQKETQDEIKDSIRLLIAKTQEKRQAEESGKYAVNFLKTVIAEKRAENHNESCIIKKCLSQLETLNEEKAAIQAKIESIENFLKNTTKKQNHGLKQKLYEKRDCAVAWKLLTNTALDSSSTNICGYHFNKNNLRYRTFEMDPKDCRKSEKLWALISENNKNDQ